MTIKEQILKELAFDLMIKRGLEEVKKGRVVSDDHLKKEIEQW